MWRVGGPQETEWTAGARWKKQNKAIDLRLNRPEDKWKISHTVYRMEIKRTCVQKKVN